MNARREVLLKLLQQKRLQHKPVQLQALQEVDKYTVRVTSFFQQISLVCPEVCIYNMQCEDVANYTNSKVLEYSNLLEIDQCEFCDCPEPTIRGTGNILKYYNKQNNSWLL